jgi:hypothetical protein
LRPPLRCHCAPRSAAIAPPAPLFYTESSDGWQQASAQGDGAALAQPTPAAAAEALSGWAWDGECGYFYSEALDACPGPTRGGYAASGLSRVERGSLGLLYGRAGCLTAKNGRFPVRAVYDPRSGLLNGPDEVLTF